MSLHLGNISPRIRKDELERVFRQFGRCSVLLKEGYGFAKYDFEGDAEAALRALKGRKICGQTLDLSWSDRKPKSHQRLARADKPHDMMQRGRNTERNGDRMRFNRNAGNHENYNQNKEFFREGGRIQPNQVGTERRDLRNGKGKGKVIDKQMGFDRYQPGYGDERFVEYNVDRDSASGRMLSDKYMRIHHSDNTKVSQACFKCGAFGHKVRDCPLKGGLNERKSKHSDHRHEKEPEIRARDEVEGPESSSRERLGSSNRYLTPAIQYESEPKNGTTCSQVENESNRTKEKYNGGKKRREREDPAEGRNDRKVRRLGSSYPHSDHSRSQEPLSIPGSRSLSRSSLPHPLSVNSRSETNSHNSRSRSHSRSSSLSVSQGRSAESPLNEERVNFSSPNNVSPTPHSKEILTEINKLFEPDEGENSPMENGTDTLSENQQPELDLVDYDPISPDCPDMNSNEPFEDEEILNSEVVEKNNVCDATSADISAEKHNVAEKVTMKDQTEASTENQQLRRLNSVDNDLTSEKLPDPNSNDSVDDEYMLMKPVNASDSNAPSSSDIGTRLRISADEVNRVLKHYGLKHRENDDHIDNAEDYFGCARMCPWEMIYYRRHKKGLVSAENHARRVAQNTAFGIVDKFIRSSSGWFEPIEALP